MPAFDVEDAYGRHRVAIAELHADVVRTALGAGHEGEGCAAPTPKLAPCAKAVPFSSKWPLAGPVVPS